MKTKLLDFSLKKFPYTLRDGCVIGVKDLSFAEDNIDQDDWQTEDDKEAKEKYYAMKEQQKKDKIQDGGGGRKYNDDVGIEMKLDFMQ